MCKKPKRRHKVKKTITLINIETKSLVINKKDNLNNIWK